MGSRMFEMYLEDRVQRLGQTWEVGAINRAMAQVDVYLFIRHFCH